MAISRVILSILSLWTSFAFAAKPRGAVATLTTQQTIPQRENFRGFQVGSGLAGYNWKMRIRSENSSSESQTTPAPSPFLTLSYAQFPRIEWGFDLGITYHQFNVENDMQGIIRMEANVLHGKPDDLVLSAGINFSNFTTSAENEIALPSYGYQMGAIYRLDSRVSLKGSVYSMRQSMQMVLGSADSQMTGVEFTAQYLF